MTTRTDLDELNKVRRRLENTAATRLAQALGALSPSDPLYETLVADAIRAVGEYYGDATAQAALAWYEQVRPAGAVPMRMPSIEAPPVRIDGAARILQTRGKDVLVQNMRTQLRSRSRDMVRRCMDRDPAVVSWARVPAGATTCAFCLMLASRGWVYRSQETAEHRKRGDRYHADCDCTVAPSWDRKPPAISGYDPDSLYSQYMAARNEADGTDESSILAAMRRMDLPGCSESVRPN